MAQTVSNRELRDIIFRNIKSPDDRKKLYQYLLNLVQTPIEGWDIIKRTFEPLNKRKFIEGVKPLGLFDGTYDDDYNNILSLLFLQQVAGNKAYISLNNNEEVLAWVESSSTGETFKREILFSRDGKVYRLKEGIGIVKEGYTATVTLPNIEYAETTFYRLVKNETHIDPNSGETIIDRYAGFYIPTPDGWIALYEIRNKYSTIKKLQDYAYELNYDDFSYDDAAKYLEEHYSDFPIGGCTIIQKNGIVGGNFDYVLSNNAEFVIKTNNNQYRNSVIGVAGNVKGLTDEFVNSKEYDKHFDYLPCMIESGMNDKGLVMKMNLVSEINDNIDLPTKYTNIGKPKVCGLMLVRMVLDKCNTIEEALDYIQNDIDIYMPYNENFHKELHYMLTDGKVTYSISTEKGNIIIDDISENPILTNFRIHGVDLIEHTTPYKYYEADINTIEDYGMGVERYNSLSQWYKDINKDNMMENLSYLRFSARYDESSDEPGTPLFKTEFTGKYDTGDDLKVTSPVSAFATIFAIAKQYHEDYDRNAENTWITTHSVIYNINKKEVSIHFQEDYAESSLHTFKIKSSGGDDFTTKSITWSELKLLRDNNELVAGQKYRITDYECTTVQSGTAAANNKFDIIVTAIDSSHLSEDAYAAHHEEDTYFKDCNLDAWRLKYSLDNDEEKFAWAFAKQPRKVVVWGSQYSRYPKGDDPSFTYGICWKGNYSRVYSNVEIPAINSDLFAMGLPADTGLRPATSVIEPTTTEGKGIIYRMVDEFGNDCPYDFKNIKFYRKWKNDIELWSTIDTNGVLAYTFSNFGTSETTEFTDNSLSNENNVNNNIIKPRKEYNGFNLNNICFFGNDVYNNIFDNKCYNSTIGQYCYNNIIKNDCRVIIIKQGNDNYIGSDSNTITLFNYCSKNHFGNKCTDILLKISSYDNIFEHNCMDIVLGEGCYNNIFQNDTSDNVLGDGCTNNLFETFAYHITLGDGCTFNTFKLGSGYNQFGDNCSHNLIGTNVYDSVFGEHVTSNILEEGCRRITIGDNSQYNYFGNGCYDIKLGEMSNGNNFGPECSNIVFTSNTTGTIGNYFSYNTFEAGCSYITLYNTEEGAYDNLVQNYKVSASVSGSWTETNVIEVNRNNKVEINIAKNSNGTIRKFCIADIERPIVTTIPETGIKPNVFYTLGTISSEIIIMIDDDIDATIDNEWTLSFDIGEIVPRFIGFPPNTVFPITPYYEENTHYEVNIKWDSINNKYFALLQSWSI